jgi:predicted transcriptional regulator of viral defense system
MDWAQFIAERSRTTGVFRVDDLSRELGLSEHVVRKALVRQQRRGLVEHVGEKVFWSPLAERFDAKDLIRYFRKNAYVSLQTVLRESGISTQIPSTLTCVTTEHQGTVRSKSLAITFQHISPKLFWGFREKPTLYGAYKTAEPEKALLDWVYLLRQRGLPAATDEFDVSQIDRGKLLDYSQKYPKPVRQQVTELLAEFAAGRSGSLT